ncbi:hypothetical protein LguiB_023329 [Lonicera macranthoides]
MFFGCDCDCLSLYLMPFVMMRVFGLFFVRNGPANNQLTIFKSASFHLFNL